ncbi:hypothetical protein F5Y14DRAFT_131207 [Nemania sp. NC0429]|nr:hypothetical protein F5Y14DRAFT_131207 [Nemania sp. NC0429]
MYRTVIATTLSLFTAYLFFLALGLKRNRAIAASSGFKCVLLPTHLTSVPWLIAGSIFLPLLELLPDERKAQWMLLLLLDRIWHSGHRPFAISGADTIMAVAPSLT